MLTAPTYAVPNPLSNQSSSTRTHPVLTWIGIFLPSSSSGSRNLDRGDGVVLTLIVGNSNGNLRRAHLEPWIGLLPLKTGARWRLAESELGVGALCLLPLSDKHRPGAKPCWMVMRPFAARNLNLEGASPMVRWCSACSPAGPGPVPTRKLRR